MKIIMSCIKIVSFSAIINGVPIGHILPSRGLRQGDLLLPYLFLICAMGLQGLIHKAESDRLFRGVSICRNGPQVSHLFFADDSVLFCQVKESECQVILDIYLFMRKGLVRKQIETKLIYFSMLTPIMISRLVFKCYWVFHPLDNMKNI